MRHVFSFAAFLLVACGGKLVEQAPREDENEGRSSGAPAEDDAEDDVQDDGESVREEVRIEPLEVADCPEGPPACEKDTLDGCTLRCFRVSRRCRAALEFWPLVLEGSWGEPIVYQVGSQSDFVYFTLDRGGQVPHYYLLHWSPTQGLQAVPDVLFPDVRIDDLRHQFLTAARDADVLLYRHRPADPKDESAGVYLWKPGGAPQSADFAWALSADGQRVLGFEGRDVIVRDVSGSAAWSGRALPLDEGVGTAWLGNDGTMVVSMGPWDTHHVFFHPGPSEAASDWQDLEWQDIGSVVPNRADLTDDPPLSDTEWKVQTNEGSTTRLTGIVAEGRVLVGESGIDSLYMRPFRWTVERGFLALHFTDLPADSSYSQTLVSEDGQVLTGIVRTPSHGDAEPLERVYRWSEEGGMETLLEGTSVHVHSISSRGDVIWADSFDKNAESPTLNYFRWTREGGLEEVPAFRSGTRIANDGKLLLAGGLVSYSKEVDPLDLSPLVSDLELPEGWSHVGHDHVAESGRLLLGTAHAPIDQLAGWIVRRMDWCEK